MERALDIHSLITRRQIKRFQGYEVKTQGDAFMVSFALPELAVDFCLNVQLALLEAEWPEEVLNIGPGSEVKDPVSGDMLFRGLRFVWIIRLA